MILVVGLSYAALIVLKRVHYSSLLSRTFIMKSCWILSEIKFLDALIPDASEILEGLAATECGKSQR